jgi:3-hydroxybutyryl-CoA dehydrogenase
MSAIQRVGILGCGQMGSGIAQVCAQAGYDTVVREVSDELWQRGLSGIGTRLARLVEKGKLEAGEPERVLARLSGTSDLAGLRECDLVIEAVVEEPAVKNDLWRALDDLCPPATIFASNTSSLSIVDMAAATRRPSRMVGLHFFNPVPVMKLVEVVGTIATDPEVFRTAFDFARSLGKEPIACKDRSGFVVNRLLVPYLMDAVRALEQGVASMEDIDRGMQLGTGHPMGPFALCDFIGIDTIDRVGEIMFQEYREQRYAPPALLKRMVALGYLGRKSGRGFYDYAREPAVPAELRI